MSNEVEKDLYKLIGKYEAFSAQVLNALSDVNRSLIAGEVRMSKIEQNLAQKGVCPMHEEIISRLDKKDAKDEEHDMAINQVKTDVQVVEYRLSTRDVAKIGVIAAGIAAPIIELFKWALTRTL